MQANHLRYGFAITLTMLVACSDSSDNSAGAPTGTAASLDEIYDQGLTRYVGAFSPASETDLGNGVRRFDFALPEDLQAEPRGPLCLRGTPYGVETRTGQSDELLIWLHEGGACWPEFCAVTEEANSIFPDGILNQSVPGNPLAEHDLVFVPYCDGSLFTGDVDRPLPPSLTGPSTVGETMSYQRGAQNLSAALDIARREFPNPSRVVLVGPSGGSFGTIVATPLVRFYYPGIDILVIRDSGLGIVRDGDPDFINGLLRGWNADSVIPASCVDCTADGNVINFIEWNLENDPNLYMAPMAHMQDGIIAGLFLMLDGPVYQAAVLEGTGRLAERFPTRYKRFLQAGSNHMVILNSGPVTPYLTGNQGSLLEEDIDGVRPIDWISAAVQRRADWVDTVQLDSDEQ
ncbi:MAG: pectin acetylesterase-family hydrolase [Pseudomonadota bacterium]